jgi:hypothetical protein
MQVWTCYIISMPSGGLVANHNRNQCITSTLGWRKFTVNKQAPLPVVHDLKAGSNLKWISFAIASYNLTSPHAWHSSILRATVVLRRLKYRVRKASNSPSNHGHTSKPEQWCQGTGSSTVYIDMLRDSMPVAVKAHRCCRGEQRLRTFRQELDQLR